MIQPEDFFSQKLEIFRTEADSAIQFFYSYLTIHEVGGKHKEVYRLLNTAPLFWNTTLGALQTSTFITLGRIFEQKKQNHNLDHLIKYAQDHIDIFSKQSLAERKRKENYQEDIINNFMQDVYVPVADDFRQIKGQIKNKRKIYESNYSDIRHRIFAHKEISDKEIIRGLFSKTNKQELQDLLFFLNNLHDVLWQLFINGRKPNLHPPQNIGKSLQERLSNQIEAFLLASINKSDNT